MEMLKNYHSIKNVDSSSSNMLSNVVSYVSVNCLSINNVVNAGRLFRNNSIESEHSKDNNSRKENSSYESIKN